MRKVLFFPIVMLTFSIPAVSFAEEVAKSGKSDLGAAVIAPVSDEGGFNWEGYYAGATIGYGFGETEQIYDRAGNHGPATLKPDGLSAALTIGANWMYSPHLLLGVEGDLGSLGVSQGTTTVFDGHNWSSHFGGFATLRGRAGYVIDNTLLYGTAGLAVASIENISIGNTAPETAIEDGLNAGWVIGFGAEYAVNHNWTVKGEFLHMDFGKVEGKSANNEDFSFEDKVNVVRMGANYKF